MGGSDFPGCAQGGGAPFGISAITALQMPPCSTTEVPSAQVWLEEILHWECLVGAALRVPGQLLVGGEVSFPLNKNSLGNRCDRRHIPAWEPSGSAAEPAQRQAPGAARAKSPIWEHNVFPFSPCARSRLC